MAKIFNAAFCLLVVLIWIVALALTLYTLYTPQDSFGGEDDGWHKVLKSTSRASEAYYIMYLIAAILGTSFLSLAMTSSWINLSSEAKGWLTFTLLVFFIHNVANIVEVSDYVLKPNVPSEAAVNAFNVFDSIGASLTILGIQMSIVVSNG